MPLLPIILTALMEKEVLQMTYLSKNGLRYWKYCPHRIVHADGRYHLRGLDLTDHRCKDARLDRVLDARIAASEEWVGPDDDTEWNTQTELRFRITDEADDLLKDTFVARWGRTEVNIKGPQPLVYYLKRSLLGSPFVELSSSSR
jgi:predicted DNA-binding transcriptional regulator YafY